MNTVRYFCFPTRDEAMEVLTQLKDMLYIRGSVTIEDLYDLAHRSPSPERRCYGWVDLKFAKVKSIGINAWALELPQPTILKKGEEMKDNKQTFTRDDLKAGYIIKLRDGTYRAIHMVGRETLIVIEKGYDSNWVYLSRGWDNRLYHTNYGTEIFPMNKPDKSKDIVAVYGYIQGSDNYVCCGEISPNHRPLLWSRQEAKRMTVKDIETALGYEIEIVAD